MVTVSDFTSFLNRLNAFEVFAKALKEYGAPSLRKIDSDEDRVERFFDLATDLPFIPVGEIIKAAFAWGRTEEPEETWMVLSLLWKAEANKKENLNRITREEVENYLESQGILEEIKKEQRKNLEENIRKGELPGNVTVESLVDTIFTIEKPQLYIEGTVDFLKTGDPEKWININKNFLKWLATR